MGWRRARLATASILHQVLHPYLQHTRKFLHQRSRPSPDTTFQLGEVRLRDLHPAREFKLREASTFAEVSERGGGGQKFVQLCLRKGWRTRGDVAHGNRSLPRVNQVFIRLARLHRPSP